MAKNKIFTKRVEEYLSDQRNELTGIEDEDHVTNLAQCDSPIEELMYMALVKLFNHVRLILPKYEYCIETQKKMNYGRDSYYKADIAISLTDEDFKFSKKFIVECDGHDFHEKTKEQVRADKTRERYFTKLGYIVIRFSGSEINESPDDCALEVFRIAERHCQILELELTRNF